MTHGTKNQQDVEDLVAVTDKVKGPGGQALGDLGGVEKADGDHAGHLFYVVNDSIRPLRIPDPVQDRNVGQDVDQA